MSYKLLVTQTSYQQIEYDYGRYRTGRPLVSTSTTVSFDTRKEANAAFKILKKKDYTEVTKLYEETK